MNKLLFISFATIFSALASAGAQAGSYECFAKANADRGFKVDFTISVNPASVGGQILLKVNGRQKVLGVISEAGLLNRDNTTQKAAFDLTLGLVGAEDVSGIPEGSLEKVKSIEVFRAKTADSDEVFVYKLLSGNTQMGGTILVSGMGTACLPK